MTFSPDMLAAINDKKVPFCYNETAKKTQSKKAMATLRKVVNLLGLEKDSYNLWFSEGGIAVWGEAILHTDTFYIQFQPKNYILVRSCKGRGDYCGGRNTYVTLKATPERIAEHVRRLLQHETMQAEISRIWPQTK